jgi:hypothetical protein
MTQRDFVTNKLADAFDKAATSSPTKWHAAKSIILDLQRAGILIVDPADINRMQRGAPVIRGAITASRPSAQTMTSPQDSIESLLDAAERLAAAKTPGTP